MSIIKGVYVNMSIIKYVNYQTKLNPADDATCWTEEPLRATDRWFAGPTFLLEDPQCWSKSKSLDNSAKREIDSMYSRRNHAHGRIISAADWEVLILAAVRFRKLSNRWQMIAAERAKKKGKCRQGMRQGPDPVDHLDLFSDAERYWLREIQLASFDEDFQALKHGRELRKDRRARF